MHDFLLAKEIIGEVRKIVNERNVEKIKTVFLEIGSVVLPRDHIHEHTHDKHLEELNLENIKFGLEALSKNTPLAGTVFKIKKIDGNVWKIAEIEIE